MRVLHVDDEPDFAELAADFLEREDDRFEIEIATSAEEGLETLSQSKFDCIISDYDMPGWNGLEFLDAVREEYPGLPLILYTGKGSEEVASDAISAGVSDYLQKESGTDQYTLLANRVRNTIEGYRSSRRAADLDRLRTLAADVNQALVRAKTREQIETSVCEIFSSAIPYRFAWIGSLNEASKRIEASVSAGADVGSPIVVTVPEEGTPNDTDPISTAASQREVTVSRDPATSSGLNQMRDAIIEVDVQAVAAVPFDFQGHEFGVLTVCADQPDAFDDTEVELLEELGDDIAHAIDAIETNERLREERDRRSGLFENNPNPVVDFKFKDEDPVISSVNPAFETIFDYEPDSVIGRPVGEVLVPNEGQAKHAEISHRVYQGERVEAEVTRQTASGPRDFLLRVFPYDVNDRSRGGYAWYVDISERVERENRLSHEQSLLEAVMETSIDGILVIGEDREYVTWNQQFLDLWGVPEELIGDQPEEVGLEFAFEQLKDPDEFIQKVEYLYEHPSEESRDQIQLVDGRVFDRYSAPVEAEDGTYFGRVWFFRDVTDRVDAVRELEEKNARLEEFASILSHDLRNPLNVAEGRLQLVQEKFDDDNFDAIERALDRMEVLIDDMLRLAREGAAVEETEAVDISDLMEACWQTVETADAQLSVETELRVQADESRLQQLLENVIRNAIEHGGSDVTVTIGDLDDRSGLFVEDTGPGIPAEDQERVFESGVSRSEAGTGFGLPIVERIAHAHGWTITVAESHTGGARFEFSEVDVES